MQIFVDSANLGEIECWLRQGIVDGVTTNPSIMLKDGVSDMEARARQLCKLLIDRPVSIEVTTNDPREMLQQARVFAKWARNVVIKIPVITEDGKSCLEVVNALTREEIAVNCTALLSFNQAILAAKAGATYVSIFAGRIADEGGDSNIVVRNVRAWLDQWAYPSRIIVGSIRAAIDVQNAALAGAHVVTVPPQFLSKMVDHRHTRETVRQFNQDAEKAMAQIRQAQLA
ncbi:MAG TPA: transaldolase family protein [Terriglobales bacterium]|nr:transaldolase family protein [Terriglobales bacterium]